MLLLPAWARTRGSALVALVVVCLIAAAVTLSTGSADAGTAGDAQQTSYGATTRADGKPTPVQRARTAARVAVQRARHGAPIPQQTTPTLAELNGSRTDLGECDYGKSHNDSGGRLCERGDRSADRTIVLLGDSHAKHWVAGLQRAAVREGWSAYYLVKEQCTAPWVYNGDPDEAHPQEPWAACQDFREFAMQSVADLKPDLVVVSTSIPSKGVFTDQGYIGDQSQMVGPYKKGFRTLFRKLHHATDGKVVLLRDVPARKPKTDPLGCFRTRRHTLRDCLSPQDSQAGRVRLVDASVDVAKAEGVRVVDPTSWLCWDGVCPALVGKQMLPYRNTSHLTVPFSKSMAGTLTQVLRLG